MSFHFCGRCVGRPRLINSFTTVRRWLSTESAKPFNKILIANRGEIACRIMETCQKMGIKTVAIHSDVDSLAKHVAMADEALCVGTAPSAESYLDVEAILAACELSGADAVHPGYGFLSENSMFSDALDKRGIKFIGPKEHAVTVMGDKIMSKKAAEEANVSVIPGNTSIVKDEEMCVKISNEIGYPVMVKAAAGGGGKGMRLCRTDAEAATAFRLCTSESQSSFGDARLFIEKFIENPRHIEIQVLVDSFGNAVHVNERECSIQRRNQKVIEEAPSVVMNEKLRAAMGKQACDLALAVQYQSAGTCEFLMDKDLNFYFCEMNTRIQVEHPVTEMTTGIDLIEHMIRIAAGEKLSIKQEDVTINGWSFESRVYAENPVRDFLPSTGYLRRYQEPLNETSLPGTVRIDSGIREGAEISIHYDPMISKLITHGATRQEALEKMKEALDSYVIRGVTHNIPFLKALCQHPKFEAGDISTNFIADEYPEGFKTPELTENQATDIISTAVLMHCAKKQRAQTMFSGRLPSYKEVVYDKLIVTVEDKEYVVSVSDFVTLDGCGARVKFENQKDAKSVTSTFKCGDVVTTTKIDGVNFIAQLLEHSPNSYVIQAEGSHHEVVIRTPREFELFGHMPVPKVLDVEAVLLSPMPGSVFSISVEPGSKVVEGDEVAIVEAMKMQNVLIAPKSGIVKAVHVAQGDTVSADDVVYELE